MNLEATGCGVPRQVQPRVAAYDHAYLYQLINLDRQSETEWTEGGLKQFGKLQVSSSVHANEYAWISLSHPNLILKTIDLCYGNCSSSPQCGHKTIIFTAPQKVHKKACTRLIQV